MKTNIILEIGCNHQGGLNTAKEMIAEAFRLGVYGVKFQKRDIDSIPQEKAIEPRDISKNFGENYYEHRKALEFSFEEIKELKDYAERLGLLFCVTAFDVPSLKGLLISGVKWLKFPSQLLLKKEMYDAYNQFKQSNCKLIVSTGMHRENEITTVLNYYSELGINVLYHCVSIYPAKINESNLGFLLKLTSITSLKQMEIGYSSHEEGAGAVPYAVAMGAKWIERHFTLCKGWKGHDHSTVSSTPDEIREMIMEIKKVESILGTSDRMFTEKEKITAGKFRDDFKTD